MAMAAQNRFRAGTQAIVDWRPLAMEDDASQVKSLSKAMLLHALVVGLLYVGIVQPPPVRVDPFGEPIEVTLVGMPKSPQVAPKPTPAAVQPARAKPQPPQPASNLDDVTDHNPVIQEVRPPDPNSIEKPEEITPPVPTPEEITRAQKLDDLIREKEELARKREELQRVQNEQEALANAIKAEEANNAGMVGSSQDQSKMALYASMLNAAIQSRARLNDRLRTGLSCRIVISQVPGGEVLRVITENPCNATEVERDQLIDSVLLASPLPYEGFEDVFAADIGLTFIK